MPSSPIPIALVVGALSAPLLLAEVTEGLQDAKGVRVEKGPLLAGRWGDELRGKVDILIVVVHPSEEAVNALSWAEVDCWPDWEPDERPRTWLAVHVDEDGECLAHPEARERWARIDAIGVPVRIRRWPRGSRLSLCWEPGARERAIDRVEVAVSSLPIGSLHTPNAND
jgi:hypothetical protein